MEEQQTEDKVVISAKEIAELAKEFEGKSFSVKDILIAYTERKGMFETISEEAERNLMGQISRKINHDIKQNGSKGLFKYGKNGKGKTVKTLYALVKKRVLDPTPPPPPETAPKLAPGTIGIDPCPDPSSMYIGKAGEYAVMSELLLRGYNANEMTVDDGIDVIASRNNVVYYIQVKTSMLQPNKTVKVPAIKRRSYDHYIEANMRYIICIRLASGPDGIEKKAYVVFTNKDIDDLKFFQCLRETSDEIHLKLKFDNGKVYAYHNDEARDISNLLNNFDLH